MKTKTKPIELWYKLLSSSLKLPGAIVWRKKFIKSIYKGVRTDKEISFFEKNGYFKKSITESEIDQITQKLITREVVEIAGKSFFAGLPGGFAAAITLPADVVQFYMHHIVIIQKLAYLFGWKKIIKSPDDKKGLLLLTLFFGIMHKIEGAEDAMKQISGNKNIIEDFDIFGREDGEALQVKEYLKSNLEKTNIKSVIKRVAGFLGVRLLKNFAKQAPAKVVPILGGAISGGLSYISAKKYTSKLVYFFKKTDIKF